MLLGAVLTGSKPSANGAQTPGIDGSMVEASALVRVGTVDDTGAKAEAAVTPMARTMVRVFMVECVGIS